MSEPLTRQFTKFRFVVEVEADSTDPLLVPPSSTPTDTCSRVLADEIASNLNSLDGVAGVTVEEVATPSR
jgi:hypothetical protein